MGQGEDYSLEILLVRIQGTRETRGTLEGAYSLTTLQPRIRALAAAGDFLATAGTRALLLEEGSSAVATPVPLAEVYLGGPITRMGKTHRTTTQGSTQISTTNLSSRATACSNKVRRQLEALEDCSDRAITNTRNSRRRTTQASDLEEICRATARTRCTTATS